MSFVILHHASLCLPCALSHYLNAPEVTWQLEGRELNNTNIFGNGTLCISDATDRNAGQYTCRTGEHTLTYQISLTSKH